MNPVTEYTLLASVFYQRQQGGAVKRFHAGDTVTGLSEEKAARLLRIGAITPAGAAAKPKPEPLIDFGDNGIDDDPAPEPAATAVGRSRPKAAQSVDVWRDYAVSVGIPAGEAAEMTKKQLQEATK